MNSIKTVAVAAAFVLLSFAGGCGSNYDTPPTEPPQQTESATPPTEQPKQAESTAPPTEPAVVSANIYLYGEQHGVEKILQKELDIWGEFYGAGVRHLFVEFPYYTAEFLNIWMKSGGDDILEDIYGDTAGTPGHVPAWKEFYKTIKDEYPETVFHGTDVGHQYDTTGLRYLRYLEASGDKDSERYALAAEAIEQGQTFYRKRDGDGRYREIAMTENFTREFDALNGEDIVGFYGNAHTGIGDGAYGAPRTPNMASRLYGRYGDRVYSVDLSLLARDVEPLRTDTIVIENKAYDALFFGEEDISGWTEDYASRAFWRLERAYGDFGEREKTNDVLPYNNYPMFIEIGQVFVIDYTMKNGDVERRYYRADGNVWNGLPTTVEFVVESP